MNWRSPHHLEQTMNIRMQLQQHKCSTQAVIIGALSVHQGLAKSTRSARVAALVLYSIGLTCIQCMPRSKCNHLESEMYLAPWTQTRIVVRVKSRTAPASRSRADRRRKHTRTAAQRCLWKCIPRARVHAVLLCVCMCVYIYIYMYKCIDTYIYI